MRGGFEHSSSSFRDDVISRCLHARRTTRNDIHMSCDIQTGVHIDAAVVPAGLVRRCSFGAVVNETETVYRSKLQQISRHDLAERRGAAEPVKVRICARLWNIWPRDKVDRVVRRRVVEKRRIHLVAVQGPADSAIRHRVAVDMRCNTVAVLRDDAGEVHIEEAE